MFVGPPFHALPWAGKLEWQHLSIVVHIRHSLVLIRAAMLVISKFKRQQMLACRQHKAWMPHEMMWSIDAEDPEPAQARRGERWWFPEVHAGSVRCLQQRLLHRRQAAMLQVARTHVIDVKDAEALYDFLAGVPANRAGALQFNLTRIRGYFKYEPSLDEESASRHILQHACR